VTTSLHIHVVAPPITDDHLLVVLASTGKHADPALWEAISRAVDESRDMTPEERQVASEADVPHRAALERARVAIASNEELVRATVRRYEEITNSRHGDRCNVDATAPDAYIRSVSTDAFNQMNMLAPSLYICESDMVPDNHGIYDLVYEVFVLDDLSRQTILDAVFEADQADPTRRRPERGAVAAFLAEHAGRKATIIGH
jgi:hypothetical protein